MKSGRMRPPGTPGIGASVTRTPGLGSSAIRTPLTAGNGQRQRQTPLAGSSRRPVPGAGGPRGQIVKDGVEVFCRLRPDNSEESCVQVIDETTLQLQPPASSRAFNSGKETRSSFKHVFDTSASQSQVFDRVGLPLVQDLIQGKNGLLFTYGVTGSGKTHTMQGSMENGGVMARTIDVLFNSISEFQTRKFQLKSDRLNGFQIQSDTDAALERQQELVNNPKMGARRGRANHSGGSEESYSQRVADSRSVQVDEDMQYSVFASFVEIYNNYVYDLLDTPKKDLNNGKQRLVIKALREDSYRNMYVHGAVEVEVKSPEEALDAFYRGQKQRRVAETTLNLESSRSHSVFMLRLVAAPLDPLGEDILMDQGAINISQLALVDLAGSERTNRTGNTGTRLAEASKINQSLLVLRQCIETLRENQNTGGAKAVPYRESKVTHLFRNYFEGDGKVKMVVCVNPRASDFDENINVMKFSELTQEVQIERKVEEKVDPGLTKGRRMANKVYKEAMRRLEQDGVDVEGVPVDLQPVYSLGPEWPPLEMTESSQEDIIIRLKAYLEQRIRTRTLLLDDMDTKYTKFRNTLMNMEQELVLRREESKQLKSQLEIERKRNSGLQSKLGIAEATNKTLTLKVAAFNDMKVVLENELDEKELELNLEKVERLKTKSKYQNKIVSEKERLASELKNKYNEREDVMRQREAKSRAKLNAVKNLLINDCNSDDTTIYEGARGLSDNNRTTTSDTMLATPNIKSSRGRRLSCSPEKSRSTVGGLGGVGARGKRRSRSTDAGALLYDAGCVLPMAVPQAGGRKRSSSGREKENFKGIEARIRDLQEKGGMLDSGTPDGKRVRI